MFICRIKFLRIARGMTQEELATKSGVSQVQISNLERNSKGSTIATLEAISLALDVCMHDLYMCECERYEKCTRKGKENFNCYPKNKK